MTTRRQPLPVGRMARSLATLRVGSVYAATSGRCDPRRRFWRFKADGVLHVGLGHPRVQLVLSCPVAATPNFFRERPTTLAPQWR